MTTFEQSIQIAASPDTVWAQITNPAQLRKWWTSLHKYEYASETKSGVGMTFVVEERISLGPLTKARFEVTRWVKNEHLGFRLTSGVGVQTYEMTWQLAPSTEGTQFTYVERFVPSRTLKDRIWGVFGTRTGQSHVAKRLGLLKALAEAATRAA